MTTLITGGIGWVPSHITRAIAATGEQVVTYDLMEPDDMFDELLGELRSNVTTFAGDITDVEQLSEVCARYGVTSIVHAAAITPRRDREMREPARIIDVNLGGTVNALDAARTLPNFRRFIYISSGAAIGEVPGAEVIDESTPSHATSLYGITKHTSERVVSRYRALFDLDAVSVRLANVFGPMERITPGYVGATELREMLRIHFDGQPVKVNSLAGPWLDWTYVGDIAEGIKRIWEAPALRARCLHEHLQPTPFDRRRAGGVRAAPARLPLRGGRARSGELHRLRQRAWRGPVQRPHAGRARLDPTDIVRRRHASIPGLDSAARTAVAARNIE